MNRVLMRVEGVPAPKWSKTAVEFVKKALKALGHENWEVSVLFCNNAFIKTLNAEYRGKDEPTDVLAFPLGERIKGGRYLAGDIVLSLDALAENEEFFGVCRDEEVRRLLLHAILHLSGDDHATNEMDEPMLIRQEAMLKRLADKPSIHIQENIK